MPAAVVVSTPPAAPIVALVAVALFSVVCVGGRTVIATVALRPSTVAVMVADPAAMAVMAPADVTVATAALLELQLTTLPTAGVPSANAMDGAMVSVSPISSARAVTSSVREATRRAIVTVLVALTEPIVAVMVEEPTAMAFTRPEVDTVAMVGALEVHVVLRTPVVPSDSVAVADSASESPSTNAAVAGVTDTDVTVTTGGTGGLVGGASPPPPQAASPAAVRRQRTSDRAT